MKQDIQRVKLSKLKSNPKNPRVIRDEKFKKLVASIKEFPEMLEARPIVVDEDFIVLGGNMRLRACQELKMKEVFIKQIKGWTEEQKDEFTVKDNSSFGEWDWEVLANEWEIESLNDWGLDVPNFGNLDNIDKVNSGSEEDEWVGMPEFEAKDEYFKIVLNFDNDEDRIAFSEKHGLKYSKKTEQVWSTTYPFDGKNDLMSQKYDEISSTNPE